MHFKGSDVQNEFEVHPLVDKLPVGENRDCWFADHSDQSAWRSLWGKWKWWNMVSGRFDWKRDFLQFQNLDHEFTTEWYFINKRKELLLDL